MNGALLLTPFLLIRFALPAFLEPSALRRAARFAPMQGKERVAYFIYQAANAGIFLGLFFLTIRLDASWRAWGGLACYLGGLGLCAVSLANFSFPDASGLNTNGVYRFSRNPIYIAYFLCFIGMALLTASIFLLTLVLVFQVSAHWMIRAEERWCLEQFGAAYARYMQKVRPYL